MEKTLQVEFSEKAKNYMRAADINFEVGMPNLSFEYYRRQQTTEPNVIIFTTLLDIESVLITKKFVERIWFNLISVQNNPFRDSNVRCFFEDLESKHQFNFHIINERLLQIRILGIDE